MIRRFLGALLGIMMIALLSVGLASPASAAPVAPAGLPISTSHSLVVKNVGNKTFFICNHWGWTKGSASSSAGCAPGFDRIGTLQPGHSSLVSYPQWPEDDVDGIEVPKGYSLKRDLPGPNTVYVACNKYDSTIWLKMSPSLSVAGHTKRMYLKHC